MARKDYPKEFLDRLDSVTAKRPRTVIDFILEHGSVTTEQLNDLGYEHPPRAVADVKDHGIPIVSTRVPGSNGRKIARYEFGDPSGLQSGMVGRSPISK